MEHHWKFVGGGAGILLKGKFLKAVYDNKLEFPRGGGGVQKQKKPSVGEVWIFSATALWGDRLINGYVIEAPL